MMLKEKTEEDSPGMPCTANVDEKKAPKSVFSRPHNVRRNMVEQLIYMCQDMNQMHVSG